MSNDDRLPIRKQAVASQAYDEKADRANRKRVPSALTPDRQREAISAVRARRSVHQVAKEFSVSESVILELWLRDIQRCAADLAQSFDAKLKEIDDELHGRKPYAHKAVA